jgi:hypothetical protein
MPDPCPECGADRVMVGRVHNCRPRPKPAPDPSLLRNDAEARAFDAAFEKPAPKKNRPASPPKVDPRAVLDAAVAAATLRQRRWREKNRDKYNANMRAYRSKGKAAQ